MPLCSYMISVPFEQWRRPPVVRMMVEGPFNAWLKAPELLSQCSSTPHPRPTIHDAADTFCMSRLTSKHRTDFVILALHLTLARLTCSSCLDIYGFRFLPPSRSHSSPNPRSNGPPTRQDNIHLLQGSPPPCQQQTQPTTPIPWPRFCIQQIHQKRVLKRRRS
jgi:hypothetical protein